MRDCKGWLLNTSQWDLGDIGEPQKSEFRTRISLMCEAEELMTTMTMLIIYM